MENKIVRRINLFTLIILVMFALIPPVSAISPTDKLLDPIVLGQHYEIFRDTSKKASIEDLLSGVHDHSFVASNQSYPFFWHTEDTIWLRLSMDDILIDNNKSYWLEVTDKLDSIDMYVIKADGTYEVQKRGIANLGEQSIPSRSNLFQINDPAIREIYFKLDGALPFSITSYLYSEISFINKISEYKFLTGIFYGFLSALLIYNLFLYFSLKDKAYFFYVLYMLSFIFYQATLNSLDIELLGSWLPKAFFIKSLTVSGNLLLVFMLLFCIQFLELKKFLPLFHKIGKLLLWITICSLMASFIIPDVSITNNFTTSFAVVVFIFLWLSGIFVLVKGQKMARFYLIGWTVLLGSIIVQALAFLSVIPFHPRIFEEVPAIGAIFESIFLSLALGDKINIIKKEHQIMQETLNEQLEEKVHARTQELELAKLKLEVLANTDHLTQIPNRVRLDDVLEKELEQAQRNGTPLSTILLDIDHFKAVNDEHGHQVGDIVLQTVAELLKNNVRAEDIVGRWGGEEFLVICPCSHLKDAVQLSENLRQQLEQHSFPVVGHKTGSFGVTCFVMGDTIHSLLSRCDMALYQAKHHGRNRVEFLLDHTKPETKTEASLP
ncbi:diguanylate cyclase [Lysinibacillus capsici]|uniref:sensor domain-containing diguanylate cyclase n=1 Tax=Lysinibacillus capsici TaxID=2115968 RepID=UPI00279B7879|nr:diguanylate cyclase [Lysinibacillus capsici]WHP43578.1 diguanylate cyclase [Lysinibacillus boronitolerans]